MTEAPFKGPFTVEPHYWEEAETKISGYEVRDDNDNLVVLFPGYGTEHKAQWLCARLNQPTLDAGAAAEEIEAHVRLLVKPWVDFLGYAEDFAAIITKHCHTAPAPEPQQECQTCCQICLNPTECPEAPAPEPARTGLTEEEADGVIRQLEEIYDTLCDAKNPDIERPHRETAWHNRLANDRLRLRAIISRISSPVSSVGAQSVADEIAVERKRQIEVEGWTAEHDDEHGDGALARAGGCYALYAGGMREMGCDENSSFGPDARWSKPQHFPFDAEWWKPKSQRRDLIRAAALIVAEIDRIDRLTTEPLKPAPVKA